jgi:hypothetical protein
MHVPRFSFGPTIGDQLVAHATGVTVHLTRWPTSEDASTIDCTVELKSEIPLSGDDAGSLLAALISELRQPRAQEGGELC